MSAPEPAQRSGPQRWQPPRWLKIGWIVLCLVAGAARFAFATSGFDYLFGVVLVVLGLSYLRDLRRTKAAPSDR